MANKTTLVRCRFALKKIKTLVFLTYFSCATLNASYEVFPDPYPEVYDGITVLPLNRHGWHLHEKQVDRIFNERTIETVIEVGSWTGNWTIFVAEKLPAYGKIFAIDHWKGSIEHQNPGTTEHALLPTLFNQFLSNVIHCGMTDKVIPVRMASLKAAKLFKELGICADMIYIDAGHSYQEVIKDISAWRLLLSDNGILCGDDWNLGDISKAVTDYGNKHGLKTCHEGEFWWYE